MTKEVSWHSVSYVPERADSLRTISEEQWVAIALLYGPPGEHWLSYADWTVPLQFRMVADKVLGEKFVGLAGIYHVAFGYALWCRRKL